MFFARYRASGFDILEYACGDHDADNVPFTIVATDGVYLGGQVSNESFSSSGVRDKYAELMKTTPTKSNQISVRLRRLDRILTEQSPTDLSDRYPVDRCSEGWELEVLEGINLRTTSPRFL